jgi:hypothetical protein
VVGSGTSRKLLVYKGWGMKQVSVGRLYLREWVRDGGEIQLDFMWKIC